MPPPETSPVTSIAEPSSSRGRVFISWSGPLSQAIAQILRLWIEEVLQQFDVFVSAEDVEKGEGWYARIFGELQRSDYGIVVLTEENKNSPWVLLETGVMLGAQTKERVTPFLVGLSPRDLAGSPLNQLQATEFNAPDVRRMIHSMNHALPGSRPDDQRMDRVFDKNWISLKTNVDGELAKHPPKVKTAGPKDGQMTLLEDVLRATLRIQQILEKGWYTAPLPTIGLGNLMMSEAPSITTGPVLHQYRSTVPLVNPVGSGSAFIVQPPKIIKETKKG